jgi:hypothetical protein
MLRQDYILGLNRTENLLQILRGDTSTYINISYISLLDIEAILRRELDDSEMKHGFDVLHNCDTTSIEELTEYMREHEYFGGLM